MFRMHCYLVLADRVYTEIHYWPFQLGMKLDQYLTNHSK